MDGDRRGDWENDVNKNLISLNTAVQSVQKLIEELELDYAAFDRVLRGDAEEGTDGLIARQHTTENMVNELRAELRTLRTVVEGDHTGTPGLKQKVDSLLGKRERSEKREGYFWHFITASVGSVLMVRTLLILNWERIEDFVKAHWPHSAQVTQQQKKKHGGKKKQKPIVLPELQSLDDATGDKLP